MTDINWTARIDALLAEKPDMLDMPWHQFKDDLLLWYQAAHRLAAERLREPHGPLRIDDMHYDCTREDLPTCTCGKDADLLRILEGK